MLSGLSSPDRRLAAWHLLTSLGPIALRKVVGACHLVARTKSYTRGKEDAHKLAALVPLGCLPLDECVVERRRGTLGTLCIIKVHCVS